MKPDYKNWIPKGMIWSFGSAFLAMCAGLITAVLLASGTVKTVLMTVLGVLALISGGLTVWSVMMYRAFDYNGKRKMSSQIIEGTAVYVKLPQGGKCLDVGCGSGALSIAVAKKNPKAFVIGVDRWGKEYASFSKGLCERNARAEGVTNAIFQQGDATHLVFPDEYFDAVTSNYVYHNIPGDRKAFLTETLRTLKKGGCFAIHDIMSASKYGNMQAFVKKLKGEGYEEVKLIDTANGMFMKKSEAYWMGLCGSALLIGKK